MVKEMGSRIHLYSLTEHQDVFRLAEVSLAVIDQNSDFG